MFDTMMYFVYACPFLYNLNIILHIKSSYEFSHKDPLLVQDFMRAALDKETSITISGDMEYKGDELKYSTCDAVVLMEKKIEWNLGDVPVAPPTAWVQCVSDFSKIEDGGKFLNVTGFVIEWDLITSGDNDKDKVEFTLEDHNQKQEKVKKDVYNLFCTV